MERDEILQTLKQLRQNSTFLVIHNYTNIQGELSKFQVSFHVNYDGVLKRSLKKLALYNPANAIYSIARDELIDSYRASITRMEGNDFSRMENSYQYFFEKNKVIKGVKVHRDSGEIHITGYMVNKVVIKRGTYPHVNSSAKTIAKQRIAAALPIGRYRQFKLCPERFERIEVQHHTLFPPEDYL